MFDQNDFMKLIIATHYFAFKSQDCQEIADAVSVSMEDIWNWSLSPAWGELLSCWGYEGDPKVEGVENYKFRIREDAAERFDRFRYMTDKLQPEKCSE